MRWLDRLLMAELVVLTALLGCFLDKDMDIWWHLRAGREILAGRGIPRTDSYLFALPGAEWIDLHWGFQVAAAWLFQHGGFTVLTMAAAIAAAIAIALAVVATADGRSAVAIVWCWLPAVFVMSARFYPRPEIVSLVCLAGYLLVLQIAERRPRALWLLVPIQLVWVNVQGLFILGPIVLGCWLLDRAIEDRGPDSRRRWRVRGPVAVAVALACFVNPYTWKGALFPLTLFRRMSAERGFYGQHIGELMSIPDLVARTGITSVYLRIAVLLLVATAVSFGLQRMRSRQLYFRSLLFVLFAGLGTLATRNQLQFALIAGAVLAWSVGDWLATRPPAPLIERAITRIVTSAVLVGLMFWVTSGRFYAYAGEGRIAGVGQHPLWYAHDAARLAARDDMPRHFIAYHEGQAAVFEFHMRPDQQVFVDPRLEVSPRHALQQYYDLAADMSRRQSSWPERLRGFPQPLGFLVDHLSYHAVEAALLVDDRWRCIWFDAVAGVYVPSTETRLVDQRVIDFGSRYFAAKDPTETRTATGTDAVPVASLSKEAESLFNVGRDLLAAGPAGQSLGRVFLLLAVADARAVLERVPRSPRLAQLVANASLGLYPAPARETPLADSLEMLLGVARARYLLNRAVQQAPADFQSWLVLFGIAEALGDPDALLATGVRVADLYATNAVEFEFQRRVRVMLRHLAVAQAAEPPVALPVDASEVLATTRELTARHRYLAAVDFVERSFRDGVGLPAPSADLLDLRATLLLIAGDPARTMAVWTELAATSGARSSLVSRRLANAAFVEGRLSDAVDAYRASLASDRVRSAARYGLAISHLERGDRADFVRECRMVMRSRDLPEGPVDFCRQMVAIAERSDASRHRPADAGRDRR